MTSEELHQRDQQMINAGTIEQLRARIYELELELAAEQTSPLTQLPARRRWSRLADAAYPDAGAVLLGDVDGLKAVNDAYGHRAGDELIAQLADRLRTALGTASVVGHLSGDEFAAILPISPEPHHLDRVHDWVVEPLPLVNGPKITPGLSLGVIDQLAEVTRAEAMHGADLAMYAAKAAGGGWRRYDANEHGPLAVEPGPVHRVRHQRQAA